jgi:hypothetical protein
MWPGTALGSRLVSKRPAPTPSGSRFLCAHAGLGKAGCPYADGRSRTSLRCHQLPETHWPILVWYTHTPCRLPTTVAAPSPPHDLNPRFVPTKPENHPGHGERGAGPLTGAEETLGQPSEATRIVRGSIFHVGAEGQRPNGGKGEGGASGPPKSSATGGRAGAEARAAPAGARKIRGVRAACTRV